MLRRTLTLAASAMFLLGSAYAQQEVGAPDPFFAADDVIEVTLTGPLETLLSERPIEEELPATFQIGEKTYDVAVRTRGRFRRRPDICEFPPIRLNFNKSETKGTEMHGVNKVKIVTHCNDASARYDQTVVKEYVAYRIMNILSDVSFRARLIRLRYVDSEGTQPDRLNHAIVIEHRDRLAKRLDRPIVEESSVNIGQLDPEYTNLVSVFHYMIGNTDFSPVKGAEGERCCHNHILFGSDGQRYYSVPYDFDQAGLVNAPHAGPNPRFNLRNVQERLYRGRCLNNPLLPDTMQHVRDKQEEILQLIATVEGVSESTRKVMSTYVKRFYSTLQSDKLVARNLEKKCI
ncbi:MAG: hypothetical protein WBN09_08075 [Woeseiaceae bacterium]